MDFERPTLTQRLKRLTGNPVDFDLRPYADLVAKVGALEPEVARLDRLYRDIAAGRAPKATGGPDLGQNGA
jgi:hypothetical protein